MTNQQLPPLITPLPVIKAGGIYHAVAIAGAAAVAMPAGVNDIMEKVAGWTELYRQGVPCFDFDKSRFRVPVTGLWAWGITQYISGVGSAGAFFLMQWANEPLINDISRVAGSVNNIEGTNPAVAMFQIAYLQAGLLSVTQMSSTNIMTPSTLTPSSPYRVDLTCWWMCLLG